MTDVNPYGAVTWTKYTLGDGDTFGSYNLKRLNPHTEAYDLIAVVTDIDTVAYSDHLAWPGRNTYLLTATIETGGLLLESLPVVARPPGIWTDRNAAAQTGSTTLESAAIGPDGTMIQVGNSGYVCTSTDGGKTWVDRNAAAGSPSVNLRACAIADGTMLVVGASGFARISRDDGASWTDLATAASTGSTALLGCAVGPDGYLIIVGDSGYVRTSTDGGVTWTDRNTALGTGAAQLWACSVSDDGALTIVTGNGGIVATSTDAGANWTDRNTAAGISSTNLRGAAAGPGGRLVIVGNGGTLRTSDDGGASWSDRKTAAGSPSGQLRGADIGIYGEIVVCGNGGVLVTSGDGGATWTDHSAAASTGTTGLGGAGIAPDGTVLVCGDSGYTHTSTPSVLAFRHAWLHDPGDPTHAVQVLARSLNRQRQPNVTYQFAGGADLPEPYVRRGSNRQWRLSLVPGPIGTGTTWDALADLMERQFTHAAKLCLRLGFRAAERHFVMLDDLGEDMQGGLATPSATATAVSYVEAAT